MTASLHYINGHPVIEGAPDMWAPADGAVAPAPEPREDVVLNALHNARIELGAYLRFCAMPNTKDALADVCKAIELREGRL